MNHVTRPQASNVIGLQTLLDAKQDSLTFVDSANVSHTNITTIDCASGTVSGTTLSIPAGGGSGAYDDSALQASVAANTSAITARRLITDSYSQSEITTFLDGKVDDSQVLTNVPVSAHFTDQAVKVFDGV